MENKPKPTDSTVEFQKHELLLELMKIFNTCGDKDDFIGIMLRCVHSHTGIEALALRFSLFNDFPYITSAGFSEDFIESERYLSSINLGTAAEQGPSNHRYECICGIILEGAQECGLSCFSEKGSFRVNSGDDHDMLALVDSGSRKFRCRCIAEGYNSIALIPVRAGNETVGLLQLCDTRKGIMTNDLLNFFESCCEILGLALRRKNNEYSILKTNIDLENIIEERTTELLKTIADKEKLVDEVNHRIKNNLLIISSLLNLQVMKESDSNIRNALNGALIRINSIGIIHQRLYSSRNLDNINIEKYVLALHNRLLSLYRIDPHRIEFSLMCNGISTNIDTAIPCGLIFNEILSNSIRHALIPEKLLSITVSVAQVADSYIVEITDNGPGLTAAFNPATDGSLGMELIRELVKQLDGTIQVINKDGLTWKISIMKEKKEEKRWIKKTS
ncbi:MAG TPA: histidine kinase dimerization/phosphoacceptor domain -containing protein [Spirochaetota bacterium]|nr:histidine kinase dimerization/phosphoacceptor domain -containing protein [Spirochaetota bacterium]